MNEWYYAVNNEQKGPVNEAELKEMLAGNQIPLTTLVWQEGMEGWSAANTVPAFIFRAPPIPAAAKPAPAAAPPMATRASAPPAAVSTDSGSATADEADIEKNKVFAILAYLGILFLVPMLAAKDSPYAKYHANQGLVLFLVWLGLSIAVAFTSVILSHIPVIGILAIPLQLLNLGPLVLMIIGIMNAAKGQMEPLPIIGQYTLLK